ncbi:MAG: AraC family transcriptional regulator [Kiritimatiellae bacterium]|nr:AraC family transcriptional regulator [Kiritimatiellia bacterium]
MPLTLNSAGPIQRRMVNLEKLGVPGVPLAGFTRSVRYGWTVDEHAHAGCLEIGLCLRGSLVLESGTDRHTIMPGDLFVNRPDQRHRLQALPKGDVHYWIHLRLRDAPPGFLGLSASEIHALRRRLNALPCRVLADTSRIATAFHRLFKCYDGPRGNYRMFALRCACMSLVFEIAELTDKQHRLAETDELSAIIDRIRAHPEQKINLDTLAKEAALSSTRFINVFKQATGFPPLHYQLMCRLTAAKRRLGEGDESITDIAAALGFASSQHFSTHFKKMFGCTPTSFRQASQA